VAASGNVYVTGTFKGLTDFDPGPGTYNVNSLNPGQDIFISNLYNNGTFIWSKIYWNSWPGWYSIRVDAQENIYTTGVFYGTGDFNTRAQRL
jgi:hypothetical protein